MKKMYVIKLSEDGNYGVYSNIKKAYEACHETGYEVTKTYAQVCKDLKDSEFCWIEGSGSQIEIEVFLLNN